MAADGFSCPCESDEDLKARPLDERTSSNVGESLNPGKTEVGPGNKEKWQDERGSNACGQEVDGVAVCPFFLLGRCHFGNRCRLSHSLPQSSSDVPERGCEEEQDISNRKKAGNIKKMQKGGKKRPEVEEKGHPKKPRMRTADDVISRILWDPSLDPSDFSVGYLDRFLGVLERPFSEFSWDTDLCNCSYTEELALPRHRIQYFAYRGRRIWDRLSRMDGVFGSTGGPLEPPFAAEGEKEGVNVAQETRPQETGQELRETSKELREEGKSDHADGACHQDSFPVTRRPDEEEETRDLPHTLPETAGDAESDQKGIPSDPTQGKQEAGSKVEIAPELSNLTAQVSGSERGNANREGDDQEEEEWKEEWEDEEEKEQLSWHLWPSSKQSSHSPLKNESPVYTDSAESKPREQRQKASRRKPTHFITFRTDTPSILLGFQRIREEITSLFPLSAPHWVSPKSLHITICLLVLSGPEEVSMACEILREFAQKRNRGPLHLSFPPKLGHFFGRVLFLTPQPLSGLQSLNKYLQKVYSQKGWLHADSLSPNYHLTLAKMEGKGGERVFKGVVDTYGAAELKAIDFGELVVNELHLCVNGGAKMEDGFYETVCVVKLQ